MDDRNNTPNSVTEPEETKSAEVGPAVTKSAEPNYIGNTGIIDRSETVQPQIQPHSSSFTPETSDNFADFDAKYRGASMAFAETKVLLLGLGSSMGAILVLYMVKNFWAAVIISSILAIATLFFAVRDYRATPRMTPLTVVGISAATVTLVYIANLLVTHWIVALTIQGLGY